MPDPAGRTLLFSAPSRAASFPDFFAPPTRFFHPRRREDLGCPKLDVEDVHNSNLCIITSPQATLSHSSYVIRSFPGKLLKPMILWDIDKVTYAKVVKRFMRFYTQIRYALPRLFHMWKPPFVATPEAGFTQRFHLAAQPLSSAHD